jgi:hypothetical protein
VAIVQISRITARKGLDIDLPQPLAGGELGWAIDARQLYIGNGELAEGAPVVGNTEILTEYSDILSYTTAYTYQGAAGGYIVQTGATSGTPISQSLQSRLDSFAVVTDFGAVGDGVTDDTAAINRALFQLYCREATSVENPQPRRSLFFPAGKYLISDTIKIPPFALLYGEGAESSILYFSAPIWTSTIAYQSGVLVKDGATYYRSLAQVPAGILISNASYWAAETLPAYIVRSADSLQQTGSSIATNGATPPQNIVMNGFKLLTDQDDMSGLLIQNTVNSSFLNVDIQGPFTTADLTTVSNGNKAIEWASTSSLVCSHITIDNCKLSGFVYAINTPQQLKSITFSNNYLSTFYQGIYLGGAPVNGGATGFRMLGNMFDTIYANGIVIDAVSLNMSAYNMFFDVGNEFNGTTLPAFSVIDIDAENNVSVGDMFQRSDAYAGTFARININDTASIAYDNASRILQGTYVRETGLSTTLLNNQGSAVAIDTVDATEVRAFKLDYTIVRGTAVRTGTWTVVASTDGTGGTLVQSDSGQQNSSTGITLSFTETGSVVTFKYTSTNTGTNAVLHYSITHLA